MSRHGSRLVGFALLGALVSFGLFRPHPAHQGFVSAPDAPPTALSRQSAVLHAYGQLPLSFESNQGQTDRRVRFLARGSDSTLYLTPTEAVFTQAEGAQTVRTKSGPMHGRKQTSSASSPAAVCMQLVGADPAAVATAEQPLSGRVNYFIGRDPRRWHSDVPTCARARFQQVYPGVDVVYYGNRQHLEYDFVVAPHADPSRIRLRFAGANRVQVDKQGDLIVTTRGRTLTWRKPTVYQESKGGRQAVAGQFRMEACAGKETQVGFALARYDASRPLIIDPVLTYSTYLGGTFDDQGGTIAADSSGNAYVTGTTRSTDFPTTPNALQTSSDPATSGMTYVSKLNAAGTSLVYSTYLGGDNVTASRGIRVDSSGAALVCGNTSARNFPVTAGAYQRQTTALTTPFVLKLSVTGDSLLYSTLLGGDAGGFAEAVAVDSGGNAYVTGSATDGFPVTAGAFQTTTVSHNLLNSAFVTELNPAGSALVYSTYLGGSHFDLARGVALDNNGNVYVIGTSGSVDFPVTPEAYQPTNKGALYETAFVAKLSPVPLLTDFNNDGHTDLLLQNADTGQIASWFMNGPLRIGGADFSLNPSVNYALAGVGSFAGDSASASSFRTGATIPSPSGMPEEPTVPPSPEAPMSVPALPQAGKS